VNEPRITTHHVQTFLASRWTRRAALLAAGVFTVDAMPGVHHLRPALAQEGTPVASPTTGDYPELVVVAAEFSFAMPASIPAGFTRLTMQNDGEIDHHAMFMRVNDGSTLEELQEALTQPDLGQIFAVSQSLGGPEVGPGGRASVIAELLPGQYEVICVIPEADGMPHYMMGMHAPLEVTEPAGEAPAPQADLTVELVDFAFVMPEMEIAAGPQIWAAPNVGEQIHEMVILQLEPGTTFDDLQAALQGMAPAPATPGTAPASPVALAGPPPFFSIGGVAPMNPGYTNWAVLDLEPADYVAICFVPDPETGLPHFALGMIMPFTVA
jgi:uncharacterized cupredoxin-like copper-binding protein